MPSLTPEQQHQKQLLKQKNEFAPVFDRFKNKVNDIAAIFIDPLNELKICTSPNGMSERTSSPYSGQPPLYNHRMIEKKESRRILLKQLSDDLEKIKSILPLLSEDERKLKQSELDQLLLTQFEYVYYQGYSADPEAYRERLGEQGFTVIDGRDRPPFGLNSPQKTKLAIGDTAIDLKSMLETLMPKCVILDELDAVLLPVQKQLEKLQEKEKVNPEKYADIVFVAHEILSGITVARTDFIQSGSVIDGLKGLGQAISTLYTESNTAILNDHRSHWLIQSTINVLRNLMGYVMLVLTFPGRLYDNQRVQSYVNSWFEPRTTTSFRLFDSFREHTTSEHLANAAGLSLGSSAPS